MRRILALLCLFSLAGCATPEQQAEWARMQRDQDVQTCESYGFRPQTDAFGSCMLQLNLAREQSYYQYDERYRYGPRYGSGIYYMTR